MIIEVKPFVLDCTDKEQACKVLEEAAEVFGAWQVVETCGHIDAPNVCDCKRYADDCAVKAYLADEIADVIQAACNLAERYGIDVAAAMQRCEERNRERGRYGK